MKSKFIICICLIFSVELIFAQKETSENQPFQFAQPEHYMDGYSLNFQYQNGTALHMEFENGKARYEWITGPGKGNGNQNIPYRSRKIGDNMYLVNWHETGLSDYLTIVFDLEKMIIHNSIIVGYKNKPERTTKTVFKTGVIDHLKKLN